MEVSKSDWKLFRTRIGDWQEAYMGFCLSEETLIGHDGAKYNSYYVREV